MEIGATRNEGWRLERSRNSLARTGNGTATDTLAREGSSNIGPGRRDLTVKPGEVPSRGGTRLLASG